MLELVLELLLATVPQATGRAVLFVVTFGQVKCDDGVATVIGVVFWLLVALIVAVVLARL